jgi:cyclase
MLHTPRVPAATWLACLAVTATFTAPARAQQDFSTVEIKTIPVADSVYMLVGSGGNIAVSVGEDGVLMVDDQYAPLTDKIKAAIAALTAQPVKFVLNTHWHFDHTGGNENFSNSGAYLVAHENVRNRMRVDQRIEALDINVPAAPPAALPIITFSDETTFYWNGDRIHVFHVAPAHTDGDAVVHWINRDVIHTGDIVNTAGYPFIDTSAGGSIDGMIDAADAIIAMAGSNTKIIPGHGELSTVNDVIEYRNMLSLIRDRIRIMIADGMSLSEITRARPAHELAAKVGPGAGRLTTDGWVAVVYESMTRR